MENKFPLYETEGMRSDPDDRRRSSRIRLQVPLFLRGTDGAGAEFIDLTKSVNISSTGACVASRRNLSTDQILRITIPVASEPGFGTIPAETPPIQARVRRISDAGDASLIGLEFLKPLE
jgi:hypothetical protein